MILLLCFFHKSVSSSNLIWFILHLKVLFFDYSKTKRYLSNGCPIETVILDMEERE